MSSALMLVINPGSTSTKIAIYDGVRPVTSTNLTHSADDLGRYPAIIDQYDFRLNAVEQFLSDNQIDDLAAVVGRGGLLKPMASGTYSVNETMKADLRRGVQGQHASNLGGLLAAGIAEPRQIPAFIVDPVAVDEFQPVARISGLPQIERRSLGHALNIRAVSRRVANDMGKSLSEVNFVVAHLGGGISITPLQGGRILDYNNANEAGPFSPERAGTLPAGDVVTMAFSGQYGLKDMLKLMNGKSGMVAYLGTNDARVAIERAKQGDEQAELVLQAMAYQVAKEIGAMATVLSGDIDAIVITGGLAHADYITRMINEYVHFIAPVKIYPGEDELLALAEGALLVLSGQEQAKEYR